MKNRGNSGPGYSLLSSHATSLGWPYGIGDSANRTLHTLSDVSLALPFSSDDPSLYHT